jgi:hypothetical protein
MLPYFEQWWQIIQNRELAQVCFFPHLDSLHRLTHFALWLKQNNKQTIELLEIAESMDAGELATLKTKFKNDRPLLIVARNIFVKPGGYALAQLIEEKSLQYGGGLLLAHEMLTDELKNQLSKLPSLFWQHLQTMPLYSKADIKHFIKSLVTDWQLQISEAEIEEIWQLCGGNNILVKDLCRGKRANPLTDIATLSQNETFRWKSQIYYQALGQNNQRLLINGQDLADFPLRLENGSLPGFLKQMLQAQKQNSLIINADEISFNQRELTHHFTKLEQKLLHQLHQQQQSTKSREEVAEIIWGQAWADKYSDWAIDQTISRLRKKLARYNLPLSIKTQRGRGYVLT